jgi:tetratricopeptide (TPR) repeat protein
MAGCAVSRLDEAKRQYTLALQSDAPLPHYKAALEELNAAIARDPGFYQAYAIKGLIYRNLEDYEQATENLDIAKQGSYGEQLQWVPVIINLTYGEIFHLQAGEAIRAGDYERAKSYQETAIQFFSNVITTSFNSVEEFSEEDELGITMQDLYVKSQGRWAAGKFQMAVIAGRTESKERQSEILREVITRLSSVIEGHPDATSLRYYLAEGYNKQALTIRRDDPEESARLKERAIAQLRVCAELGLSADLRNPAAQLVRTLSQGTETDIEMKILGADSSP